MLSLSVIRKNKSYELFIYYNPKKFGLSSPDTWKRISFIFVLTSIEMRISDLSN